MTCTFVVSPERGNSFYKALARDVANAIEDLQVDAKLLSSSELADLSSSDLSRSTLLLVNPVECALSGPDSVERATSAGRKIAVVSESTATRWYGKQFKTGLDFDAVFDVGFVSQENHHEPKHVAYRFVFNGPRREEDIRAAESERPLRWALIGHETAARARLADELAAKLGPGGFVFLPPLKSPDQASSTIGEHALRSILERAETYVWCSHHEFAYFESFRFRDALLGGALPIKIDPAADTSPIPGVYRSVDSFAAALDAAGRDAMFAQAVEFYKTGKSLAEELGSALQTLT